MNVLLVLLGIACIFIVAAIIKMVNDRNDYNKVVKSFNGLKADYAKLLGDKHKKLKETK